MFSLMKPSARENAQIADALTLADLHVGCMVGFGFVPQKNISGVRICVTEINSYLFDAESFIAYRLEGGDADINLIIADESEPARTYLALSQRIRPRLFESIFSGYLPPDWFALKEGDTVKVNSSNPIALQGWLAPRYTVVVLTKGRLMEGDHRLRKASERVLLSRPFEYVLLVDEENEYALEAEKYEDGTMHVFATIYCPATDIGEIKRAPKSRSAAIEIIPHVSPSEPDADEGDVAQERTKMYPPQSQIALVLAAEMLSCDLRLAACLIDEAQRSQIPLSELIRRVIGLPACIKEEVYIPFTLADKEMTELAKRYELAVTDTHGVKQKIIEDLRRFAGAKRDA